MNKLDKIAQSESKRLLKLYKASEKKIKAQLAAAQLKGNDATYLRKTLASIGNEIASLSKSFDDYAQVRLPLIYKKQGITINNEINTFEAQFDVPSSFGKANNDAMVVLSDNTRKGLKGITLQMGRQSADFLRKVGLLNTRGMVLGSETWLKASKAMTQQLQSSGMFHVKYKMANGTVRKVPSAVYSRMVARTTSAEAFRIATHERIVGRGYDLVDVLGVSRFETSPCIPYQGTTLSITGKTEGFIAYETAKANGFNHPNCIHSTAFSEKNERFIK